MTRGSVDIVGSSLWPDMSKREVSTRMSGVRRASRSGSIRSDPLSTVELSSRLPRRNVKGHGSDGGGGGFSLIAPSMSVSDWESVSSRRWVTTVDPALALDSVVAGERRRGVGRGRVPAAEGALAADAESAGLRPDTAGAVPSPAGCDNRSRFPLLPFRVLSCRKLITLKESDAVRDAPSNTQNQSKEKLDL